MDELIDRIVATVGVDRSVAERAVGIIFAFLLKEGPRDKVQALLDRIPGADAAVQRASDQSGAGGFSSGMGGIMGAANQLMAAGLSMGQIQALTQNVIAYGREKAGEDVVGDIVGAIPGLGQFV